MNKDYQGALDSGVDEFLGAVKQACDTFMAVVTLIADDDALSEDTHEARKLLHEITTYKRTCRQIQTEVENLVDYVECGISDSVR